MGFGACYLEFPGIAGLWLGSSAMKKYWFLILICLWAITIVFFGLAFGYGTSGNDYLYGLFAKITILFWVLTVIWNIVLIVLMGIHIKQKGFARLKIPIALILISLVFHLMIIFNVVLADVPQDDEGLIKIIKKENLEVDKEPKK